MLKQDPSKYAGFRQAGIRLTEPLDSRIISHRSEYELPRLYAIHLFDKAHVTMLVEENLIPRDDGIAILNALRRMEDEGVEETRLKIGGGMHSGETYLIRNLSEEIGGRIHLGRSSGDLGKVSTRIYTRDQLLETMRAVNDARRTLVAFASEHLETVMPGYTHGQHAQPTTLGHVVLSWVSALERDFSRLELTFKHTNTSPAGAAILSGSDFPLNRHRVAEFLGFSDVERNTYDAILAYDDLFEVASSLSILYLDLARWADDIMLWSGSEFGFVDVPDRYCGTSSIMMQKKNVYLTQWVKGAAADAVGCLVTNLMADRAPTGLPILEHHYSRDALVRTFECLRRDLGLFGDMVPALNVNKERMLEDAGAFWAQAADVAGTLVRERGLPWRTAHQIVGILVRLSYERGIAPREVTSSLLDEASTAYMGEPLSLDDSHLADALDPRASVHRRTLYGGPAPDEVRARIEEYSSAIARDEDSLKLKSANITDGLAKLEDTIDRILT